MRRIRYREINRNKHEVIVLDHNEALIGYVYYDTLKKTYPWFVYPYFVTLFKDTSILKVGYEDFTKAGRALVDIWEHTMYITRDEITKEYIIDDLFKNFKP